MRLSWVSSTALTLSWFSTSCGQNYGSLGSIEPAKVILEKDRNAFDTSIVVEIDRTMKKHTDNLIHMLESVSARLTQLESRTRHLETSVDDLKVSVGNNHGSTDGKMRQLENILKEVFSKTVFFLGIWFCCGCLWYIKVEIDVHSVSHDLKSIHCVDNIKSFK